MVLEECSDDVLQRLRILSQNIAETNRAQNSIRVSVDEILAMRDEGRKN